MSKNKDSSDDTNTSSSKLSSSVNTKYEETKSEDDHDQPVMPSFKLIESCKSKRRQSSNASETASYTSQESTTYQTFRDDSSAISQSTSCTLSRLTHSPMRSLSVNGILPENKSPKLIHRPSYNTIKNSPLYKVMDQRIQIAAKFKEKALAHIKGLKNEIQRIKKQQQITQMKLNQKNIYFNKMNIELEKCVKINDLDEIKVILNNVIIQNKKYSNDNIIINKNLKKKNDEIKKLKKQIKVLQQRQIKDDDDK